MKLTIENGYGSLSCDVSAAKSLRVLNWTDTPLEPDVAAYAVCRFLRKSRALCGEYVRESYRLRLAKGKARKTKYRSFLAPASLMELPGVWCAVKLYVSSSGVVVEAVGLYLSIEAAHDFLGSRW